MSLNFQVSKNVILTGAGFTHNFGGFLAKTMWAMIHNRYQRYTQRLDENQLIKEFKRGFDYEEIYQVVVNQNKYKKDEKEHLINSVFDVYDSLDSTVRNYRNSSQDVSIYQINKFLSLMNHSNTEKTFFFSLNQDLFIERYFSDPRPVHPGLNISGARFISQDKVLEANDYIAVPTLEELERRKSDMSSLGNLYYVKLHGSFDWRDKNNEKVMVIGTNKTENIKKEPILKWYHELFREVLNLSNRRLLIIGYGFRDKHINQIIAEASNTYGLKVFIISPHDPEDYRKNVLQVNQGWSDSIWNKALCGYYPYTLKEIFPMNGNNELYNSLIRDFFD